MRRVLAFSLLATLVLAGDAAGAEAEAAFRTPGAQWLELRSGHGRAAVARKGVLNLNVRRGRVRVVDLPGGTRPRRSCNRRAVRVSGSTVEYRGRRIRCLVSGAGPWQVIITGRGIFASGRVRGSLTLDGVNSGPTGTYRIGERSARSWPRSPRTFLLRR